MEDLFREMMEQNLWKKSDPRQLALAFYAPFFLLISLSDQSADKKAAVNQLTSYVEAFIEKNAIT